MATYNTIKAHIWRRKCRDWLPPCHAHRTIKLHGVSLPRVLRRAASTSTQSPRTLLPKIGQSSIWQSIVPRALRNRSAPKIDPEAGAEPEPELESEPRAEVESKARKKTNNNNTPVKNPASYFIWIYILIGSQAIRILQMQHDLTTFTRKAELRIDKLRQVVDALQRGEGGEEDGDDVGFDVERALGTGDPAQELEWEEALRAIEDEDRMWQRSKQRRVEAKMKAREEVVRELERDNNNASPVNEAAADQYVERGGGGQTLSGQDPTPPAPGFH